MFLAFHLSYLEQNINCFSRFFIEPVILYKKFTISVVGTRSDDGRNNLRDTWCFPLSALNT